MLQSFMGFRTHSPPTIPITLVRFLDLPTSVCLGTKHSVLGLLVALIGLSTRAQYIMVTPSLIAQTCRHLVGNIPSLSEYRRPESSLEEHVHRSSTQFFSVSLLHLQSIGG